MIELSDVTIIIGSICFIAILIILAKISRQLDKLDSSMTFIRTRIHDISDSTKWHFDLIKSTLKVLEARTKKLDDKRIKWMDKGGEVPPGQG